MDIQKYIFNFELGIMYKDIKLKMFKRIFKYKIYMISEIIIVLDEIEIIKFGLKTDKKFSTTGNACVGVHFSYAFLG